LQKKEDLEKEIEKLERPYRLKRQYILCMDELGKITESFKSSLKGTSPVVTNETPRQIPEVESTSHHPPVLQSTKQKKIPKKVVSS
jgi:hypothetical protein